MLVMSVVLALTQSQSFNCSVCVGCLLQDSLRESCSEVTRLQQQERERELEREQDRERERDQDRNTQALRQMEAQVQALVQCGHLQLHRSPSGNLDLQPVPVIQQTTERG